MHLSISFQTKVPVGHASAIATVIAALSLFAAAALAGGGGSNGLFTLDPDSPSILNCPAFSAADIFVDDPGSLAPGTAAPPCSLTQELTAAEMGLAMSANIDALSCGQDALQVSMALAGLIPIINPLNLPQNRYQFSVQRQSNDDVQGLFELPHMLLPVLILRTQQFRDQFILGDEAGDVLDNQQALGARLNFLTVDQRSLELTGSPPLMPSNIDNIDGLMSLGGCGVDSLSDGNAAVYFSVDAATAQDLAGVSPGDVLVRPPTGGAFELFASAAQLGLQDEDDVDALSVLDQNQSFVFDEGDAVVFSLREGSPSLPVVIDGIPIDQGGIFLSVPGQVQVGGQMVPGQLITGLSGVYFSLAPQSDLDSLHCVDPLTAVPDEGGGVPVLPFEALHFLPGFIPLQPTGEAKADLYLSNAERGGGAAPGGVQNYFAALSLSRPSVAEITGVEAVPPFQIVTSSVSQDGQSAAIQAQASPPLSSESSDVALLRATIKPIAEGTTAIHVTDARITGPLGAELDFLASPATIDVRPAADAPEDRWIPQFGHGSGAGNRFSSEISLLNLSSTPASFTIAAFDDQGAPSELLLFNGASTAQVSGQAVGGGTVFQASLNRNSDTELSTGWVRVTGPPSIGVEVLFNIIDPSGSLSSTNVRAGALSRAAAFAVRLQGSVRTGLALLNPISSSGEADIELALFDAQGIPSGVARLTLGPGRKTARFMDEFFLDLTEFSGSAELRSTHPIAILPLRQEGTVLTTQETFPLRAELPPP